MTNAQYIGKLIFLYTRKELNPNETAELDSWRQLSAKNEAIFQDAINPQKIRMDLKALEASRIHRMAQSGQPESVTSTETRSVMRRIAVGITKIAVSVLLLFASFMGFTVYRFVTAHKHPAIDREDQLAAVVNFSDLLTDPAFNRGFLAGFADLKIEEGQNGWLTLTIPDSTKRAHHVYYRLFTSEGNQLQLNFEDSTHIWLHSNATIKYPSWQRTDSIRLFLSGESYVHIPTGTNHHYVIKISPPVDSTSPSAFTEEVADKISRSMYLFTKGGDFYLKANFGNDATTATLISGSLRIDSVAGKAILPVTLEPGQQVRLDSGKMQILKPEHVSDMWNWKNR